MDLIKNIQISKDLLNKKVKLAVVGLGYVGMPIALEFAKYVEVIGFDIDEEKVSQYQKGIDHTNEVGNQALMETTCDFTCNPEMLKDAKIFIVTVPTPIDNSYRPNLFALEQASAMIGKVLKVGDYVIYESTVYPGATEEVCLPLLEEYSGLSCPKDFKIGYSPERINPGDKVNRIDTIVKIVSGIDEESKNEISEIYKIIVKAGVYLAETIKVAEAAKVAENSQRDVNIAFMNELALIFDSMGIDTGSVLNAMKTKWNALNFYPGLVGGHCIGVDPYYFIYKSNLLGLHSELHSIARKLNEQIPNFIAEKTIKLMIQEQIPIKGSDIAVLGITFKENCPDSRNSKVVSIIQQLLNYGINITVFDPLADPHDVKKEYGITLCTNYKLLKNMDALIIAVAHDKFLNVDIEMKTADNKLVVVDIKGLLNGRIDTNKVRYWKL